MRYLCSALLFFVTVGSSVFAQTDTLGVNTPHSHQTVKMEELLGRLSIRQDPRITDLLVRHSQLNQRKRGTDGFRLEIFFGSNSNAREQAKRVKHDFNLVFPEIPAYVLFQTPNFKVRIGDFRNKSEALKSKAAIAAKYPNAFIVKDNIQFPELFTESFEQPEEQ